MARWILLTITLLCAVLVLVGLLVKGLLWLLLLAICALLVTATYALIQLARVT